jgi:hypothetical protein
LQIACLALVLVCGLVQDVMAQAYITGTEPDGGGGGTGNWEVSCTLYAFKGGDPDDPYSSGEVYFHLRVEDYGPEASRHYSLIYGQEVTDTLTLIVPKTPHDRTAICSADGDLGSAYEEFQVPGTGQLQISGPDRLWWFDGAQPPNYSTSVTL